MIRAAMTRKEIDALDVPVLSADDRRKARNIRRRANRAAPRRLRAQRQIARRYHPGFWCWFVTRAIRCNAERVA